MRFLALFCCLVAAVRANAQELSRHGYAPEYNTIVNAFTWYTGNGSRSFYSGFRMGHNTYVTATHCVEGNGFQVGKVFKVAGGNAKLLYVGDEGGDGIAIFQMSRSHQGLYLAADPPKRGDTLQLFGRPAATDGDIRYIEGPYLGLSSGGLGMVKCSPYAGYSGGPVVNQNGRVVGVISATAGTDNMHPYTDERRCAYFMPFDGLKRVLGRFPDKTLEATGAAESPSVSIKGRLIMFSASWCRPCQIAKSELQGDVTVITVDEDRNNPLIREYEKKTGRTLNQFPTFWVRGSDQVRTGYGSGGRRGLLGWAVDVVKTIGSLIFGDPPSKPSPRRGEAPPPSQPPIPPNQPRPQSDPAPAPAPADEPPAPADEGITASDISDIVRGTVKDAIKAELSGKLLGRDEADTQAKVMQRMSERIDALLDVQVSQSTAIGEVKIGAAKAVSDALRAEADARMSGTDEDKLHTRLIGEVKEQVSEIGARQSEDVQLPGWLQMVLNLFAPLWLTERAAKYWRAYSFVKRIRDERRGDSGAE